MMIFEDETTGLLHINEVSNDYIRNIYHYLKVGAIYQVKVLNIDEDKNFLKVSLKAVKDEEKYAPVGINERIRSKIDNKELLNKFNNWIKLELKLISKEKKYVKC